MPEEQEPNKEEAPPEFDVGLIPPTTTPPPPTGTGPWDMPPQHMRGAGRSNWSSRLIPTANPYALAAYYCAIFSLVPCFGAPLSLAGIILGFAGLRRVKKDPQLPGSGHALTGVILGFITALYNIPLMVFAIMGLLAMRSFRGS